MNIRERLEVFWSGERPDQIPYTIYQWEWRHTASDPAWQKLFEMGLGVTWHLPATKEIADGVEVETTCYREKGSAVERRTLRTSVGSLYETFVDGWRTKYLLETAEDYAVMTHIVRHTRVAPTREAYLAQERQIGPYGVALVDIRRTPLQTILVDYTGQGNFSYHLFDLEAEVEELYHALLANFRRTVELVAEGPGRYVYMLENLSAEMFPGATDGIWFTRNCSPTPQSRQIVGTHYDGKLASWN
jgi:hypothetical protein